MYAYIMKRTQIYLNDEEARALEREARATDGTKSRLIRDAIDRVYLGGPDASLLRALEESAGAWRRRRGARRTSSGCARAALRASTPSERMRLLLETSVVIDHLRGDPRAVELLKAAARAGQELWSATLARMFPDLEPAYV